MFIHRGILAILATGVIGLVLSACAATSTATPLLPTVRPTPAAEMTRVAPVTPVQGTLPPGYRWADERELGIRFAIPRSWEREDLHSAVGGKVLRYAPYVARSETAVFIMQVSQLSAAQSLFVTPTSVIQELTNSSEWKRLSRPPDFEYVLTLSLTKVGSESSAYTIYRHRDDDGVMLSTTLAAVCANGHVYVLQWSSARNLEDETLTTFDNMRSRFTFTAPAP